METSEDTGRFTAIAAVVAGVLVLVSTASYLLWPSGLTSGWMDFPLGVLRHTALFRFTYLSFALSALLSLTVVLALWDRLRGSHRDLVRWISLVGIIGYSVVALHFFSYQNEAVRTAEAFFAQADNYEGYGIYLAQTRSGEMLAAPFPPGADGEAGFVKGDVLTAVDGKAIPPGSTFQDMWNGDLWSGGDVVVSLRGADGTPREVMLDSDLRSFWNLEAQQAIGAIGEPALDRYFGFGFGLAGLWLIVINWLARGHGGFPWLLPYAGMGAGLALWSFAVGSQFGIELLNQAGLFAALALLPVWLVWLGALLGRHTVSAGGAQ